MHYFTVRFRSARTPSEVRQVIKKHLDTEDVHVSVGTSDKGKRGHPKSWVAHTPEGRTDIPASLLNINRTIEEIVAHPWKKGTAEDIIKRVIGRVRANGGNPLDRPKPRRPRPVTYGPAPTTDLSLLYRSGKGTVNADSTLRLIRKDLKTVMANNWPKNSVEYRLKCSLERQREYH